MHVGMLNSGNYFHFRLRDMDYYSLIILTSGWDFTTYDTLSTQFSDTLFTRTVALLPDSTSGSCLLWFVWTTFVLFSAVSVWLSLMGGTANRHESATLALFEEFPEAYQIF